MVGYVNDVDFSFDIGRKAIGVVDYFLVAGRKEEEKGPKEKRCQIFHTRMVFKISVPGKIKCHAAAVCWRHKNIAGNAPGRGRL